MRAARDGVPSPRLARREQAQHRHFTGRRPRQIEEAVSHLQVSPLNPTDSVERDTGGFDYPAYSISALHKAVLNAIVHRDHAAPSSVLTRPYSDRIEFHSPGVLRDGLTPEHLYAGASPWRRNRMLAGVIGYHESRITGEPMMDNRKPGFLTLVRDREIFSERRPALTGVGDITQLTIYAGSPPVESECPSGTGSLD